MAPSLITSWQIKGEKVEAETDFLLLGFEITADGDHSHEIRRWLLLGRKAMTNLDSGLRSRHYLADKIQTDKASHVQMWESDHKEGWMPKNWCFQTVVLEKTFESPVHIKQIKPVKLKGNQFWILIGKTDAEAEAPILWPPDAKSGLIRKDPDAGKDWRQKEKSVTEDEMVGWHYWLNGHELGQTLEMVRARQAWHAAVHGVTKSQTWIGDWTNNIG